MTGKDDAAVNIRADSREQRRLVARRVRYFDVIDAVGLQIALDVGDERQVGLHALRVESDEPRQHVERRRKPVGGIDAPV